MKKLIWILLVLEALSVIAIGYFYWVSFLSPQPTFLFGHLIKGYEEMLICAGAAWAFTTWGLLANTYDIVRGKNAEIKELEAIAKSNHDDTLVLLHGASKQQAKISELESELTNYGDRYYLWSQELGELRQVAIAKQNHINKLGDEILTLNLKLEECSQTQKSKKSKKPRKKAK